MLGDGRSNRSPEAGLPAAATVVEVLFGSYDTLRLAVDDRVMIPSRRRRAERKPRRRRADDGAAGNLLLAQRVLEYAAPNDWRQVVKSFESGGCWRLRKVTVPKSLGCASYSCEVTKA